MTLLLLLGLASCGGGDDNLALAVRAACNAIDVAGDEPGEVRAAAGKHAYDVRAAAEGVGGEDGVMGATFATRLVAIGDSADLSSLRGAVAAADLPARRFGAECRTGVSAADAAAEESKNEARDRASARREARTAAIYRAQEEADARDREATTKKAPTPNAPPKVAVGTCETSDVGAALLLRGSVRTDGLDIALSEESRSIDVGSMTYVATPIGGGAAALVGAFPVGGHDYEMVAVNGLARSHTRLPPGGRQSGLDAALECLDL